MAIKKFKSSKENQSILESAKSREIVHEIMNYGVSQHQIIKIIKLLSLELDDISIMKSITEVIDTPVPTESIKKTTTILT